MKPEAIYLGFSNHDCDTRYKCPICGCMFGGWDLSHNPKNENGKRGYCPECKSELRRLGVPGEDNR